MNYGFCIPDNPCEYRVVSLRAPPRSPLSMAKERYEAEFPDASRNGKTAEDKYYVFSVTYPLADPHAPLEFSIFSPDLLRAVSVIAANERELETLAISREEGFHIPLEHYGNTRNLFASLNQIHLELISHIQKLHLSGRDMPSSPKNLKQLHAQIYRDSQIQLSKTAIIFAYWTLSLARRGAEEEEKENLLNSFLSRIAGIFTTETINRIRSRILDRESLLTKIKGKRVPKELFQFRELFNLLSVEMQQPAENCLRTIMSEAKRAIAISSDDGPASSGDEEEGNGPHSILSFATFICFVVGVYRRAGNNSQLSLSPRLTRWCQFLLERYPPPPAGVTWVLPDEDDEAFLQAFDQAVVESHLQDSSSSNQRFSAVSHLVGDAPDRAQDDKEEGEGWWLSPNWLRWAWLVLEQETVMNMVDDPVTYLISMDKQPGPGPSGFSFSTKNFLYIPKK